ncbi:hypothetical protein GCM10011352_11040 [Marinobacterium zhoushanense]|uniref:Cyclic nucleotide-binding domain-containing protein n=1 Tax=Marinobacterium zhoushanense TaxID=1679163 RepID=A0ABQ1K7N9_9GAMM|nr:cyclic nucleotide-binding domain-containing protein [Marinobacterium zhoushanense]GGB86956.1 hypothetical protein GCM10011352_11040 [Marinobacterium zhoushanense]
MQQIDSNSLLLDLSIDYLKGGSSFGALSDAAIKELIVKGCVYALKEGDTLFEAGDPGDSFFIVLKGCLTYFRQVNGLREHIRDYYFGEEIGFVSLIALTERLGTAYANSDSLVLEISSDLFYALHCEMPLDFGVLMMNLSRELARRFITTSALLVKLKAEEHAPPR